MLKKIFVTLILVLFFTGCATSNIEDTEKREENRVLSVNEELGKGSIVEIEAEDSDNIDYMEILSNELVKGADVFALNEKSMLIQVLKSAMNDSVLNGTVVPVEKGDFNNPAILYCNNISAYAGQIMAKKQKGEDVIKEYNQMAEIYKKSMNQIMQSDLEEDLKIRRIELETMKLKIMNFLTKMASYTDKYKSDQDKQDAVIFLKM